MNNNLSALRYWMESYLHQDFDAEFGTPDIAMVAYKTAEPPDKLESLKRALTELLESDRDENAMRELLLTQLGCFYYYPSEWKSARDWLQHLQDILNREE